MIDIKDIQKIILDNSPAEYYKEYMKYEINYWKPILDWTLKCNNVENILDIGIAYSTLALYAGLNHNAKIVGLDNKKYISNDLIKKYNIDYVVSNIELENHIFDKKFSIIYMTEVLEHLNFNPIPTLFKIKDMLKDDGVLFLSTPNSDTWGKLHYYEDWKSIPYPNSETPIRDQHIYQYGNSEIRELFDTVGLKIEKYAESGTNSYTHMNFKLVKA